MTAGGRFLTRGLKKVDGEAALSVLAYNLIRAIRALCLWNRLNFLKLSLKKSRSELPSRIGQMWPKRGMSGVRARAS